jgi:catechol 2,3-dioxygenase-like lactoylglutathione lyase family enzyme
MTRPTTSAISPSFIVSDVEQTIAFYRDKLGFETRFQQPDQNPFFAIVGRDGAQIFIKSDEDTSPLPNPKRCPTMRWDAYVYAPDPDALALELGNHGAAFSAPLKDTHDVCAGSRFATLMATNGAAALDFYKSVFGAKEVHRMMKPGSEKLMHGELTN